MPDDETLTEVVYRAVYDAIRAELSESIDLDGAIRDVARSIIEDKAEQIVRGRLSRS